LVGSVSARARPGRRLSVWLRLEGRLYRRWWYWDDIRALCVGSHDTHTVVLSVSVESIVMVVVLASPPVMVVTVVVGEEMVVVVDVVTTVWIVVVASGTRTEQKLTAAGMLRSSRTKAASFCNRPDKPGSAFRGRRLSRPPPPLGERQDA
jgi:hypothetical protein